MSGTFPPLVWFDKLTTSGVGMVLVYPDLRNEALVYLSLGKRGEVGQILGQGLVLRPR